MWDHIHSKNMYWGLVYGPQRLAQDHTLPLASFNTPAITTSRLPKAASGVSRWHAGPRPQNPIKTHSHALRLRQLPWSSSRSTTHATSPELGVLLRHTRSLLKENHRSKFINAKLGSFSPHRITRLHPNCSNSRHSTTRNQRP